MIDQVRLNFNPQATFALNVILALIMLGIALDLKVSDFKAAFKSPKALFLGLFGHHILFPAMTFVLILLTKPLPSIGLGMLLVSSCPAGHISNLFAARAKGNVALAVSISILSKIFAIFMMPMNVLFWGQQDAGMRAILNEFSLDPVLMMFEVALLLGLPLALGMYIAHKYPSFALRINKPMRIFSVGALVLFVTSALMANWSTFMQYGQFVVGVVAVHNACALALGYYLARAIGLPEADRRAVAFETGIQNSSIALVLIFTFFGGLGGMAIVTAWWGIWHIFAGMALSTYWMKRIPT
jgi:bile acid:Na+ symporter, BASS family